MADTTSEPHIVKQFIDLLRQLLETVSVSFPECAATKKKLAELDTFGNLGPIREEIIRRWHSEMKDLYGLVQSRNIVELRKTSIPIMDELAIWTKYDDPDFTDESKEILMQYIQELNSFAATYSAIPKSLMGKIDSKARSLMQQVENGQFDPTKIDLVSLGQSLAGDLTSDDISELVGNYDQIMKSLSGIGDVQQMMANMPGMASGSPVNIQQMVAALQMIPGSK